MIPTTNKLWLSYTETITATMFFKREQMRVIPHDFTKVLFFQPALPGKAKRAE